MALQDPVSEPADHIPQALISEAELAVLRGKADGSACLLRLRRRCASYVLGYRGYGRWLSAEDAEDIVSQAIVEEWLFITKGEPAPRALEVSDRLKTAFNRVRARESRRVKRLSPLNANLAAPDHEDRTIAATLYKDIASSLRGYIGQAIDLLRDRDRNLIVDHYGLERFGFARRGAATELTTENARIVALCRARQAFLRQLEMLLDDASASAGDHELVLIRSVLHLIRNGALDRVLASDSRKKQRPET
jgi:hypothetical protein